MRGRLPQGRSRLAGRFAGCCVGTDGTPLATTRQGACASRRTDAGPRSAPHRNAPTMEAHCTVLPSPISSAMAGQEGGVFIGRCCKEGDRHPALPHTFK